MVLAWFITSFSFFHRYSKAVYTLGVNHDIRIFMKKVSGSWSFTIRKYKAKMTKKEKDELRLPYFEFNFPTECMTRLAMALRYYIMVRQLVGEPTLATPTLKEHKEHDVVRRIMTQSVRRAADDDGESSNEGEFTDMENLEPLPEGLLEVLDSPHAKKQRVARE